MKRIPDHQYPVVCGWAVQFWCFVTSGRKLNPRSRKWWWRKSIDTHSGSCKPTTTHWHLPQSYSPFYIPELSAWWFRASCIVTVLQLPPSFITIQNQYRYSSISSISSGVMDGSYGGDLFQLFFSFFDVTSESHTIVYTAYMLQGGITVSTEPSI